MAPVMVLATAVCHHAPPTIWHYHFIDLDLHINLMPILGLIEVD